MNAEISRTQPARPGPVTPGAWTQEHLARAMAPTIFCPQAKVDTCLRAHGQGATGR